MVVVVDDDNKNIAAASVVAEGTAASVKKRKNNNCRIHEFDDDDEDDDVLERETNNPLYMEQYKFLHSLTDIERNYFFSNGRMNPEHSITTARRSEIWEAQSQIGTACINQYAWVTPNQQCLHIMSHFTPLIEIGCGTNAYWCQQLIQYYYNNNNFPTRQPLASTTGAVSQLNVDDDIIVGYDISPTHGGKIDDDVDDNDGTEILPPATTAVTSTTTTTTTTNNFQVLYGGPNVLAQPEHEHRTLFLCYPDETTQNLDDNDQAVTSSRTKSNPGKDHEDDDEEEVEKEEPKEQYSMAYECMKYYTGDIMIHVGELMHVLSPIIGNDTAPYGRTSAIQFQEYVVTHFHCILQYKLPLNWLHTNNDYLSVWKRSTDVTTIVYAGSTTEGEEEEENAKTEHDEKDDDEEEEEDEEVQYRHIPVDERLPIMNVAAPCVQHLWLS